MYDRSKLIAAAKEQGDDTSPKVARRLACPRNTAWRLWHGRVAPSAALAAAVQEHYGLTAGDLLIPAEDVA